MNSKDVIKILIDKGMTQLEIARLSGIPQPTISRALTGAHTSCSERTLNALLTVLRSKSPDIWPELK
jgi:transcriptional regulator with XRE-family HTH domain